jgi:hypothetical protein
MPDRPPQRIDEIRPGFYRVRRVRSGPWVGAEVALEDGVVTVSFDGEPQASVPHDEVEALIIEAVTEGEAFRHPILAVCWFGEPIDEADYRHLLATAAWARQHRPGHPAANPDKPVDINQVAVKDLF